MVEIVLMDRGIKTARILKNEQINYLDKCLSISNPMGRLSARIIGYLSKFIKEEKINNIRF